METATLFRPVGQRELDLIALSGWSGFPLRLDWPPIRSSVTNEHCAARIASEWNVEDEENGNVGDVLRFEVDSGFISEFDDRKAGDETCLEYWIPVLRMADFNDAIVGSIDQIRLFSKWDGLPVLFVDIDGVLNPLGSLPPPGYRIVQGDGYEVIVSEKQAEWLRGLVGRAQLVWATTWSTLRTPRWGRRSGFRRCQSWSSPKVGSAKPGSFRRSESGRATGCDALTLLVKPSGYRGMSSNNMSAVLEFLDRCQR